MHIVHKSNPSRQFSSLLCLLAKFYLHSGKLERKLKPTVKKLKCTIHYGEKIACIVHTSPMVLQPTTIVYFVYHYSYRFHYHTKNRASLLKFMILLFLFSLYFWINVLFHITSTFDPNGSLSRTHIHICHYMYEYIHTYDSIYAYMHWRNVRCHDCARTHEKSGKWGSI